MREFDIYVPLFYNDRIAIEPKKFQVLQKRLLEHFEGLTIFPQPNKGIWKMGTVLFQDEIVIYRVLVERSSKVRRFFAQLKEKLKREFRQEEILIVERNVRIV